MTRRMFWMAAILALSILTLGHPVAAQGQCTPLTLTVNVSSSVTVSPGDMLTVAGTVSNCGTQAATISVTLTITQNGGTLASYTKSYQLQPGQTHPESTSFRVPNAPGTYVGTATSSNGGSATATVTVT
jgi:hypothetical protein